MNKNYQEIEKGMVDKALKEAKLLKEVALHLDNLGMSYNFFKTSGSIIVPGGATHFNYTIKAKYDKIVLVAEGLNDDFTSRYYYKKIKRKTAKSIVKKLAKINLSIEEHIVEYQTKQIEEQMVREESRKAYEESIRKETLFEVEEAIKYGAIIENGKIIGF